MSKIDKKKHTKSEHKNKYANMHEEKNKGGKKQGGKKDSG